jgi:hypothetical protein
MNLVNFTWGVKYVSLKFVWLLNEILRNDDDEMVFVMERATLWIRSLLVTAKY